MEQEKIEKEKRNSKRNVYSMIIIIVLFIIGIIIRWDYVSSEISESVKSRLTPEKELVDTTKNDSEQKIHTIAQ